ncbi:MAG: prepilin-type N-terminal cleavage/methylation domain-containing protein [Verrucomicrobiota bacterium]
MQIRAHNFSLKAGAGSPAGERSGRAFTLIELLVVIAIIGLVAGLTMPHIRGLRSGDTMVAASRQMIDDFGLARLRAINERSRIFVVFLPLMSQAPEQVSGQLMVTYTNYFMTNQLANDLIAAQCRSYAFFSLRSVGDQPGEVQPRYLTEWKQLPERSFIPPTAFTNTNIFRLDVSFPFPDENGTLSFYLPCVEINSLGQIANNNQDVRLPLGEGQAVVPGRGTGLYDVRDADIEEKPPGNSVSNNIIVLNWLTGRGKVERLEVP